MLRDHPSERNGEVVAQRKVGLTCGFVLSALQDLENELVPLVAVLAQQRFQILDCRCFERLEPVALVHLPDLADYVLPPPHVFRQEVAHAARRFTAWHIWSQAGVCSAWKSRR